MSSFVCYFKNDEKTHMVCNIFEGLLQKIQEKYPNTIHRHQSLSEPIIEQTLWFPYTFIVKNIDTENYKIVTYHDRPHLIARQLINNPDRMSCKAILATPFSNQEDGIIPVSYCCYHRDSNKMISDLDTSFKNKKEDKLFFRGLIYRHRKNLQEQILKTNTKILSMTNQTIPVNDYIMELNDHQIGISFNGAAEICYRDIEILGVNSVLFRPLFLTTQTTNPLVAEYHYVSYEKKETSQEQLGCIIDKYLSIIEDKEYLKYISDNGNAWYQNNGTSKKNIEILFQYLELEDL